MQCFMGNKFSATTNGPKREMNSVKNLRARDPAKIPFAERLEIKQLGPERPDIQSNSNSRFTSYWYTKHDWITGCSETNKVYCFPCLLFGGEKRQKTWTTIGVSDWKHLSEKVKKHEKCVVHVENCLRLALLGKTNVERHLSEAYRASLVKHNEDVEKNRYILSRIIDCIKFCGAFELALRGHDESSDSDNPGVFLGLVNFTAALDSVLSKHLDSATIFKGTSKTIQNELLDIMYDVTTWKIKNEVKDAMFLSVISDDTTDISNQSQIVVVFRYVLKGRVFERFWSFSSISEANAQNLSGNIISCLEHVLPNSDDDHKLVAQCYDGASVMRGDQRGVKTIVQNKYQNAYYVHCYAHQLNLVLQQAVSRIAKVKLFFANLNGFSSFFSRSPKRTAYLDKSVSRRVPRSSQTRWNFGSRLVNTIFTYKAAFTECLEDIIETWSGDQTTIREANGLLNFLKDREFLIMLKFFQRIMSHVDILYAQLQKRQVDPIFIGRSMNAFVTAINSERGRIHELISQTTDSNDTDKRRRNESSDTEKARFLQEVCDIIISHCSFRFEFSGHLIASQLFHSEMFSTYHKEFPAEILTATVDAYPMLERLKLQSELTVIYGRQDFYHCSGAVPLLQLFYDNNLIGTFSETVRLLNILITIPMTSCEAERCFSTLKRVKTFLRNTMTDDRLNALGMLSMEKKLIREMPEFNKLVIDKFAQLKERRANFLYR